VAARGADDLARRGVLVREKSVLRVRDRAVLRYYARSILHVSAPPARTPRTH
jgi:hypothetical protein